MSRKLKGIVKKGKLKILDIDGSLIDSVRPLNLEDTLDILQLKYGKKRRGKLEN